MGVQGTITVEHFPAEGRQSYECTHMYVQYTILVSQFTRTRPREYGRDRAISSRLSVGEESQYEPIYGHLT